MMNRTHAFACAAMILSTIAVNQPASAQWSDDPMQNLAIADRSAGQVLPKIAIAPNGDTYVGWFDQASGNFDVYLQRLDADGVEQWPHNGVLISSHPSMSFLVDWDLIADSSGNAVVVFSDIRSGGDLDVYAYRISPSGTFLWGANGVTISNNSDFEPAPRVAETTEGTFAIVWARLPDVADGKIMLQCLTAGGTPQFPAGGVILGGMPGESPAFVDIVASDNGGMIVMWVRDISNFSSPRHIHAQKFSFFGNTLWGSEPVAVFDATSVPIAYQPVLQSDGSGGAIFAWHRSAGNLFSTFVQHIDADGTERFAHNGAEVSTMPNRHKIGPAVSYLSSTDEMLVFWNERNPNQSLWGITGQRISPTGTRLWGDGGSVLLPVDNVFKTSPRSVPIGDGAMVFLSDAPVGGLSDRVIGVRVDGSGNSVWNETPVPVCSLLSSKDDLVVAIDSTGVAKLAWEDERNDSGDIYAQNINPDGTLGAAAGPPDMDGDGDVDLFDVDAFLSCVTGPGGGVESNCEPADTDRDDDVDFADFGVLQLAFTE
jgi:hypothetical protein